MFSVLKQNKGKESEKRTFLTYQSLVQSRTFQRSPHSTTKSGNTVKVMSPTIAVTQHGCFLFLALKLFLFRLVLIYSFPPSLFETPADFGSNIPLICASSPLFCLSISCSRALPRLFPPALEPTTKPTPLPLPLLAEALKPPQPLLTPPNPPSSNQ